MTTKYIRGNKFEWTASFLDVDGNASIPDSVSLFVIYTDVAGARIDEEITMNPDSEMSEWSAVWDSSIAKKGHVVWAIRSLNPPAAEQGDFTLIANAANPDPEV